MSLSKPFLLVALVMLSFCAMAKDKPAKPTIKKLNVTTQTKVLRTNQKPANQKNTFCRICCTVAMTNADGETADATRCAGWLLTSCETAAEKACSKAQEAVSELMYNP